MYPLVLAFRALIVIGITERIKRCHARVRTDKDQIKGRAKQAEGGLEETAGKIVADKAMERSGKRKKAVGKVQSRYGDLKSDVKKSK